MKMIFKRYFVVVTVLILVFSAVSVLIPVEAQASEVATSKKFGLGGILGEPTGGTGKLWIRENFAFQFHAAITWWDVHRLAGFFDFVWHPHVITNNEHFALPFYVGVGGGMGIRAPWDHRGNNGWDPDPAFWIRGPGGFSFLFHKVPVETFVEFGPALRLFPSVEVSPFFAVGGRWYF